MHAVGAFEAKTHFSALLEEVQNGEEIIITKHGHPIAKLVPISVSARLDTQQIIKEIKELRRSHKLGTLNWKALRDEGRKQ